MYLEKVRKKYAEIFNINRNLFLNFSFYLTSSKLDTYEFTLSNYKLKHYILENLHKYFCKNSLITLSKKDVRNLLYFFEFDFTENKLDKDLFIDFIKQLQLILINEGVIKVYA